MRILPVISRPIPAVPITSPAAFRIGETERAKATCWPFFLTQMVSIPSTFWPPQTFSMIWRYWSERSKGARNAIDLPIASSAVNPMIRSAPGFQVSIVPSVVHEMMASSEQRTMAANRRCSCSALCGPEMSVNVPLITVADPFSPGTRVALFKTQMSLPSRRLRCCSKLVMNFAACKLLGEAGPLLGTKVGDRGLPANHFLSRGVPEHLAEGDIAIQNPAVESRHVRAGETLLKEQPVTLFTGSHLTAQALLPPEDHKTYQGGGASRKENGNEVGDPDGDSRMKEHLGRLEESHHACGDEGHAQHTPAGKRRALVPFIAGAAPGLDVRGFHGGNPHPRLERLATFRHS